MKVSAKKITNVNDYIASQELHLRPMLQQIRGVIRSTVPKAEEVISYQVPCYKLNGMLAGFGVHKKGCSFYSMIPKLPASLSKDLQKVKYTASTLHFDPNEKLPVALIKKIIRIKQKANAERAALKKTKTS
jgi:uncharacterized protein YdhG (YjbR/CyaY superfamily)